MFEQKFDKRSRTALQRTTLNQKRALSVNVQILTIKKLLPKEKNDANSCFLCSSSCLCTYQKTAIHTKASPLLLWRPPCLLKGTKHFLNIQLCNLTGRTQSIFQLELRSDDGAHLLKTDAVSVSFQKGTNFLPRLLCLK